MKNKPTIQWGAIEPPLSEQNYFITEWKFTLKLGSCRDLVLWHTAHRSIEDFCLLCRGFSWGAVKGTKKKKCSEEHESACKAVWWQQAAQIKKNSQCTVNSTETISLRDTREGTLSVFKSPWNIHHSELANSGHQDL